VTGNRAVALVKNSREIDGNFIVDVSYDLAVKPARVTKRTVVGFNNDSPVRQAFVQQLEAASAQAEKLYRGGDAAGAAAAIAAVIKDMQLPLITSSYPIDRDPGDLKLVRHYNDYGFYLEQAGEMRQAIDVLSQVTDVDADRTVAYLNLADAQYAVGQTVDAKANYAEYQKRMIAANKQSSIPARVMERLR